MGRCGGQNGSHRHITTVKRQTCIVGVTLAVTHRHQLKRTDLCNGAVRWTDLLPPPLHDREAANVYSRGDPCGHPPGPWGVDHPLGRGPPSGPGPPYIPLMSRDFTQPCAACTALDRY